MIYELRDRSLLIPPTLECFVFIFEVTELKNLHLLSQIKLGEMFAIMNLLEIKLCQYEKSPRMWE